jgi:DNA-binding NarL/FixJ family response regulator
MASLGRVLLISDDLLFRSQLEVAIRRGGGTLLAGSDAQAEADTVFIDLNSDSGHRLGAIALLREERSRVRIIAFCHHAEKQLREAAMRAGADSCVTNGALQTAALRLAGLRVPSAEPAE